MSGADLDGADLARARLHGVVIQTPRDDAPWASASPLTLSDSSGWERAVALLLPLVDEPAPLILLLDALDDVSIILPQWAAPWSVVASRLAVADRAHDAEQVLKMGIALTSSRRLRHDLARFYLDHDRPESARPWLEKLLAEDPHDARIGAELGYVLGRGGAYDRARSLLEAAVRQGVGGANTWSALGMVAWSQRDLTRATEAFRCALDKAPGHRRHAVNLARVHEARGELVEALAVLPERGADPIMEYVAQLAVQVGDLDRAAQACRALSASSDERFRRMALEIGQELALRRGLGVTTEPSSADPVVEALRDGRPLPDPDRLPFAMGPERGAALPDQGVALPLTPRELDAIRSEFSELGPLVDQVCPAPPHALALLVPSRGGTILLRRPSSPDPPELPPEVIPSPRAARGWGLSDPIPDLRLATSDEARAALLDLATAPARPAPSRAPPIFNGDLPADLAALGATQPTVGLQRRVEGWIELARWRIGSLEPMLDGESLVLDGVHPGACCLGHGRVRWALPPDAITVGSPLWHRASAIAWLGVDAQAFFHTGRLVSRTDVPELEQLLGSEPALRRALVAATYLIWLRHFAGMARVWPEQRASYASRAIAVVEATYAGELLSWL